jgi:two-component system, cell cycle sensor histidine kinase and response regulator CckA
VKRRTIQLEGKPRLLIRYLIAVAASGAALGIIVLLNPIVGFLPLLLLAAVVVVYRYAGARPAIFTTFLCTMVSLYFLDTHPYPDQRAHKLSELIILPIVAGSIVYLLETRRKQQRVVHEQSLELSTLLNSMIEGVFVFDQQGFIVELNRTGEELAGRPRGELLGFHYTEVAQLLNVRRDEMPLPVAQMGVARALRGEVVQNESRAYVKPHDGTSIQAVISATPMRVGKHHRVIGAVLVIHDVTELAELQRRVADTERHLAIGQMASGLAHDFNNVLNTITQATALMQLNPDQSAEERRKYLAMVDRAARTGAEIIKRVRDYVKGGSGERKAVDMSQVMREALDLAEPMWRTHKGITVESRLDLVHPVWANVADLRRVFTNLIINSIQAMPNGGHLVAEIQEHDGTVYARISDTGAGIPPEVQKKMFLPYFTTKTAGTGLGLSTAQKILLSSGGNINFTSEPGQGTTFIVQLPAMQSELAKVA